MISTYTKYTKNIFKDFASFYVKKHNKSMGIIYFCSAIIILSAIVMFFSGEVYYGVLYIIFGLFFALYGVFLKFLIYLGNKKNIDKTDAYVFEDNEFTITTHNTDGRLLMTSKIKYNALFEVCLYKNYAYVYVNKVSCYILLKQNFEDETQFDNLIENIKLKIQKGNEQPINNFQTTTEENINSLKDNNTQEIDNADDSNNTKKIDNTEDVANTPKTNNTENNTKKVTSTKQANKTKLDTKTKENGTLKKVNTTRKVNATKNSNTNKSDTNKKN